MQSIYAAEHLALQQEFGTTKLAALLDQAIIHAQFTPEEQAFVASRDMFFLSSVDPEGEPTVSYKGGPYGFVTVLDACTLIFPGYDGNGMFYSMGNIVGQRRVGLLFIDFENPHRMRVQGTAALLREHPLLAIYPEAQYLVRVDVNRIWVNCPRYVHRYEKARQSKYVPQVPLETPFAVWKRIDTLQHVLPETAQITARALGLITFAEYEAMVARGEG